MIQPEPEDLPKDNPKLEIAVLRPKAVVNDAKPKAVVNTAKPKAVVNVVKGNNVNAVKASACWVWKPKNKVLDHGNPQMDLHDQGVIDSRCSRHMIGNMSYLTYYKKIDGGYVAFRGNPKRGKITGRATKDETSGVLNSFITRVKNLIDQKVKVIRCDNRTEFKNKEMNQFCESKGIKRELSVARTPQQNRVAERKNRTLIEAVRTMLADFKLPTTFWDEAVNTACFVQNMVLVTKPYNKTPYELFLSRKPALGFMKPFGCLVKILITIDHLGKCDGKAAEVLGLKDFKMILKVTTAQIYISAVKLNLVLADGYKDTTAERIMLTEMRSKTYQRRDKY
ncbi:ribonuclease H-like domain-containing protein [Tanacetum coccineum]